MDNHSVATFIMQIFEQQNDACTREIIASIEEIYSNVQIKLLKYPGKHSSTFQGYFCNFPQFSMMLQNILKAFHYFVIFLEFLVLKCSKGFRNIT